jgi:hypothetical protein
MKNENTDNAAEAKLDAWELLREARAELETLRDAVQNLRDAKGRYYRELATERIFALLSENVKSDGTAGDGTTDHG